VSRWRLVAALWLAASLGCVHVAGTVPPRGASDGTGSFLAGAARVDITPIPGIAMAGHSRIGRIGRGYWSRLHARAIYLEDAGGRGIALVSCDLWSIAGGLSDRVALLLATQPDLLAKLGARRLGREQIVLAATHTHHSPGLFSTDLFFATLSGRESGFDEALFEFLAQRIAWAIADAAARARPARVYEHQEPVAGVFRNRSLEAFRANPEAQAILASNAALPLCEPHPDYPDVEACRGIDPRVVTLRIEAARGELIAAAVVFAAHPTLVSHHSTVYSADLHGAVALGLERRLAAAAGGARAANGGPIVAVFNGAEGDVSGVWTHQTREDVVRDADAIVASVGPRLEGPSAGDWRRVDGDVAFHFDRLNLRGQRVRDPELGSGRTAWIPMPGRASVKGAEDGRSDAWSFLFHEGKRGLAIGPHGSKVGGADLLELFGVSLPPFWFTRLLTLVLPPPARVGVGVYRLGPLRLAALPGEFTTVAGRRIAAALAPPGGSREDVVLIGLAHDYAYYFTTPEEYDLQHYEGSSTLYGRWSATHVQHRLSRLAARPGAGASEAAAYAFDHRTGPRRESDTRRLAQPPARLDEGTAPLTGVEATGDAAKRLPHACWRDAVPRLGLRGASRCAAAHGGWECATPRVSIEVETASGWRPHLHRGVPEDDGGLSFLTLAGRAERKSTEATCWCSYWLPPDATDRSARFRFEVETLRGDVLHSEAFDLGTPIAPASDGCDEASSG
jgi:neutral ceramidase